MGLNRGRGRVGAAGRRSEELRRCGCGRKTGVYRDDEGRNEPADVDIHLALFPNQLARPDTCIVQALSESFIDKLQALVIVVKHKEQRTQFPVQNAVIASPSDCNMQV